MLNPEILFTLAFFVALGVIVIGVVAWATHEKGPRP